MLVEHKARGKSLDKAHLQAMDYIQGLKNEHRDKEIPRYVVVSDFAKIALYDLEDTEPSLDNFAFDSASSVEFALEDFHKFIQYFAFIPGYKIHKLVEQNPADIEAA